MTKAIIAAALLLATASSAFAESYGKPCTAEPKEKWLSLEAIQKIVTDHGYTVAKGKMKGTCAEIYARDAQGTRVEFFIDPATGNPVGAEWKAPAAKGSAS